MRGGRRWRVAAYIRLSREDGNDESLSVSNQRRIIRSYLEGEFSGEWEWAGEYVDDGATGTDWARPGFLRMLEDIEGGRVNCVVCKTLSRAFRNYADQGYFLENCFPKLGVRFISLDGPRVDSYLHPETLWGYEVPISGIMNDRYAGRTSQDVRRTLDMKRRQGEFIGAFAPYGYVKAPGERSRLIVDETAAQVVRDIFAWRLDGLSCAEIAARLDGLGVPTPSAYKRRAGLLYQNPKLAEGKGVWSPRTVSGILENRVYIGDMVQGKQRVVNYKIHQRRAVPQEEWFVARGTHPPLVDQQVFQAVQRRNPRGPSTGDRPYPLSGLLYCARCGRPMRRKSAKGLTYYACRRESGCQGASVRADRMERLLLQVLRGELAGAKPYTAPKAGQASLARDQARDRLAGIGEELYLDWKAGELSQAEYERLKARLDTRMARLREDADPPPPPLWGENGLEELNRGLLVRLVDRVEVEGRERVVVCLRCGPGQYE